MPRSKPVILVTKWPKCEEKQAILNRVVAQIHANAVIRRLSAENVRSSERKAILERVIREAEKAQSR